MIWGYPYFWKHPYHLHFPLDPTRQADEGLSHQAGEALVQKWAQESNVDFGSALEMDDIFMNQSNLIEVVGPGGDF